MDTIGQYWNDPTPAHALTGDEVRNGVEPKRTVIDFWRWAYSDLSANTRRGHLAEFIVATALGVDRPRVEWDAFDLVTADGVNVEVKSAAYVQAWRQSRTSLIKFGSLWSTAWEPSTGYESESALHADVYVFALQTCQDRAVHDTLDVDQWRFYVADRENIWKHLKPTSSPSLSALRRFAQGPLEYDGLQRAVAQVVAQ